MKNQMQLRPFHQDDAETILSWCKDKQAFRRWSADRYKDFPVQPEDMMVQYSGDNMYPFTAVIRNTIIGHILLRHPSENKTMVRFGFVIVDDELGAQRITLGVFDNNPIALHCYASVGFQVTGTDTYLIDGEEWTGKEMELIIMK